MGKVRLSADSIEAALLKVRTHADNYADYYTAHDAYADLDHYVWFRASTPFLKLFVQLTDDRAGRLMERLFNAPCCFDGRVRAIHRFFRYHDC